MNTTKHIPENLQEKANKNFVYYYEVNALNVDDEPTKYGGFLSAPSYTEAVSQLETYFDTDLLEIIKLKEYYHMIISVPAEVSHKWFEDYEREE